MDTRSLWRLVVVLLVALGSARAEDQRLAGSKLVLRKNPSAEHLVLVARDGVIAPLPGGGEDPTRVGALLDISNPRTGERARFDMAARDWSINAVGTVFRFRNRLKSGPGSEVRALVIKHHRRMKISTRALGITLDEAAQQALSVVLTTGTRRYCLLFGGRIGKDKPGRFAARNAPAPLVCPAPVVVSSTTTTSSTRPGARPTSTSVTSSTNVTNGTSATSSTSATSVPATLPVGTTTSTTTPTGASTSTSNAPSTPTTTSRPPTSTTRPPTTTTRPPTTTTSPPPPTTSTPPPPPPTTSSTLPPTTTTQPPPPTTSTSLAPPTTSSTSPPPPTTSTSAPPPPPTTTSTTSVPTTTTTTTTDRPCGLRGNLQCRGSCPPGLRCGGFLVCSCR